MKIGGNMYHYTKKAIAVNFIFSAILVFLVIKFETGIFMTIALAILTALLIKDAIKEMNSTFELAGDRLIVRQKEEITKEILYRDILYLTITRKNKKWVVLADDEGILFTIKPKIENYEHMVAELIEKNKKNKKMYIDATIISTYKNK